MLVVLLRGPSTLILSSGSIGFLPVRIGERLMGTGETPMLPENRSLTSPLFLWQESADLISRCTSEFGGTVAVRIGRRFQFPDLDLSDKFGV